MASSWGHGDGTARPAQTLALVLVPTLALTLALAPSDAVAAAQPNPERLEWGGFPVLGGNSDIGFGFGAIGSLARFSEGYAPFRWRLEALVMMTAKQGPDGGVSLPYHDDYLKLDLPGLVGGKLRLYAELGFGRYSDSGYYGLGNASGVDPAPRPRFHQYDHIYPQLRSRARIKLTNSLQMMLGATLTYNWINLYEGSLLARHAQQAPDPDTARLLLGLDHHVVGELDLGFLWDTRDHDLAPTRGMHHELSWRFCPGLTSADYVAYGGINATARYYHALLGERLVLAGRLMVDLLLGQPPFYELSRHGGLKPKRAIGGPDAVRGVPLQRYHGKVKLLANLELRSKLLPFTVFSQRFNLGLVGFFDTGRTWADYRTLTHLDGDGLGLKIGAGGGVRLQWGETFLIRVDTAWSPDADPVGFYVDINHVF
jgi:Omp85 superfamily domain